MSNTTTLTNGLKVMNFSSPHPFIFTDGSILPAVDAETARALMLDAVEVETANSGGWTDIELVFKLNNAVQVAVEQAQASDADIVLVPLPVLSAVKAAGLPIGKLRVCRVADRVNKTICTDRFCI
jgi:hypothetical protein